MHDASSEVPCQECGYELGHERGCPLSVACPACRAAIDLPCISDEGRILSGAHKQRRRAAGPLDYSDLRQFAARLAGPAFVVAMIQLTLLAGLIWIRSGVRRADRPFFLVAAVSIPLLAVAAAVAARSMRGVFRPRLRELFRDRTLQRVARVAEVIVAWSGRFMIVWVAAYAVAGEYGAIREYGNCANRSPCDGRLAYNFAVGGLGALAAAILATSVVRAVRARRDRARST